MPSLSTARRIANAQTNNSRTIGEIHKANSDWAMDYAWESDISSKVCYIYDYFHDDFFQDEHGIVRTLKDGMTYDNTNKTRIDAKFIIKSHQSMDKDQIEHYIQFRPSQKLTFQEGDDLYYFETDYRLKFNSDFPIGLFIDIPDDRKVYHKWLICRKEFANQFPKYLILPCDYELMWIEKDREKKIKRRMWSVLRMQSSYTIGTYTDFRFTKVDNQNKIWLPMNSITSKLWYTDDESKNTRVIVSSLTEHPATWTITKVENVQPFGIQKLTLYGNVFNEHTDYVNYETGEMYADLLESKVGAITPMSPSTSLNSSNSPITIKISSSTSYVKVGGSYKTFTANYIDSSGVDMTDECELLDLTWWCNIGSDDWTEKVLWKRGTSNNQIKLKFPNDLQQLGKVIEIRCSVTYNGKNVCSVPLQLDLKE